MAQDFEESLTSGSPTSEYVLQVINLLYNTTCPASDLLSSSEARERIRWILNQTKDSGDVALQKEFVRVVVTLILNSGTRNGGSSRVPRHGQLEAIWRLVYQRGDTILIAKTGYGKTIVLQAVSVITCKVTIQIVPLSRLGSSQVDDLRAEKKAR